MPFTPFHMGPGILIKSVLHSYFSLMVFAWSQILMDVQPLIVILSGEGHLHGFSHTYIGSSLIAIFAAITGKYLSEFGLMILKISVKEKVSIAWSTSILSATIGCWSHVLLDSVMHRDVEPFYPFSLNNSFLHLVTVDVLHKICLISGLVGLVVYLLILTLKKLNHKLQN